MSLIHLVKILDVTCNLHSLFSFLGRKASVAHGLASKILN